MLQALVETIGFETRAFDSAQHFLAAYDPLPCQCLVCDLRMPDIDGLEVQQRLKETGFPPPIIFLTGYAEVAIAVDAMRHGAFDFLEKPFSSQALLAKIQSALALSRKQYIGQIERQTVKARIALLTPRERELIPHVIEGRSSREIAELLGLSIRTVENHRTRIMEKLHVESTVEMVKIFIDPPPGR